MESFFANARNHTTRPGNSRVAMHACRVLPESPPGGCKDRTQVKAGRFRRSSSEESFSGFRALTFARQEGTRQRCACTSLFVNASPGCPLC